MRGDPRGRPYLTREETDERLEILGFTFEDGKARPFGRAEFQRLTALEELIAGAITDWANLEDDIRDSGEGAVVNELQEWAEEWLFG